MKGYCKNCGKEIDETELTTYGCLYCNPLIYHDGVITRRRINNAGTDR